MESRLYRFLFQLKPPLPPFPPYENFVNNKILKISFGFRTVRFFFSRDYSPEKGAGSKPLIIFFHVPRVLSRLSCQLPPWRKRRGEKINTARQRIVTNTRPEYANIGCSLDKSVIQSRLRAAITTQIRFVFVSSRG